MGREDVAWLGGRGSHFWGSRERFWAGKLGDPPEARGDRPEIAGNPGWKQGNDRVLCARALDPASLILIPCQSSLVPSCRT